MYNIVTLARESDPRPITHRSEFCRVGMYAYSLDVDDQITCITRDECRYGIEMNVLPGFIDTAGNCNPCTASNTTCGSCTRDVDICDSCK